MLRESCLHIRSKLTGAIFNMEQLFVDQNNEGYGEFLQKINVYSIDNPFVQENLFAMIREY